jgi:excisionase family DNA binding protein
MDGFTINVDGLAEAIARRLQLTEPPTKRVLGLDEAATYCGLSRDSFKKKVIRDRIRKVRLDKLWRFDKADLDAWIETHKDPLPDKVQSPKEAA